MTDLLPLSPPQVIGEFLGAELHSSRFRSGSLQALQMLGYDQALIDNPNYLDATQNTQRAQVLGLCRGWPDKELFASFPADTQWFMGTMDQQELARAYRLKSSPRMASKQRLVSVTAQSMREGKPVKNIDPVLIKQIVAKLSRAEPISPIILVAERLNGKKVLVEGHSRSTAYVVLGGSCPIIAIPAIIGLSHSMPQWAYY